MIKKIRKKRPKKILTKEKAKNNQKLNLKVKVMLKKIFICHLFRTSVNLKF